jgi:hypothetical protein
VVVEWEPCIVGQRVAAVGYTEQEQVAVGCIEPVVVGTQVVARTEPVVVVVVVAAAAAVVAERIEPEQEHTEVEQVQVA